MTKAKKIEVLEKVLIHLKKDQKYCKRNYQNLDGLCYIFENFDCYISEFPEVMELQPKETFDNFFWFDRSPENNQRIKLIEKVLSDLKKNY